MWGPHTVWWMLLSYQGLIKGSRHAGTQIISFTPVGEIKVMDILTVPASPSSSSYPLFLFSPSRCWLTPALQVQISCCLRDVNGARYKPFDWLNFHSSTKGKNAFLLMINDCRGDKLSTYMGFIFMGGFFSPLFSFPLTLSFWLWSKGSWVQTDFMYTLVA